MPRRPRLGSSLALATALVLMSACGDGASSGPAPGQCRAAIWGQPERAGAQLAVAGSWDDWGDPRPMRDHPGGWQVLELDLPPGDHGYLVVEEAAGRVDRFNPLTTFREADEQEVSLLRLADCERPQVEVESVRQIAAGSYEVQVQLLPAHSGATIDAAGIEASDESGPLHVIEIDDDTDDGRVRVRLGAEGRAPGKHRARLGITDREGAASPERVATAWVDPVAATWDDGIVYQIMIDRFRGDGGAVLDPPPTIAARAGGTLDGVRAELEAGTFDALGVSALWLSPVYTNPVEAREDRDGNHLYEGYHGYWALDSRGVDPRIGGPAALHALVAAAHARGIRVLLDLVPNHVYEANPRVAEHRAEGWFHERDPPCVCGSATCPWATYIGTCWFADYLPDFRFENPAVMDLAVDDALWWQETFDVDGFRIDAVPMMPRAVTRRLVHELRMASGTADTAFTLGEIFTGGGADGTADIRYHMGPDGLDSAFDFPLMWALREAIAHEGAGFVSVEATLAHTDVALAGSGAVMARMIGNHDVTRFATEIAGQGGLDPWQELPSQPAEVEYARQGLALGLVLTLPGLPVLYYGDELGLAGGVDPDNRRVMPDPADLAPARAELLSQVQRLAQVRRCSPALRTGVRAGLVAGDDVWAFLRDAGDERPALVIATRASEAAVALPVSQVPAGEWVDVVSGDRFALGAEGATLDVPGWSLRVLLREGDPCAG